MIAEERKNREKAFHDHRFGQETEPRQRLEPVYRLMLPANLHYHQAMEDLRPLGRVLEYGCGNGENALVFARRGLEITGIDISQSGVDHARAEAARVGLSTVFEVMDAENLTFSPETFAGVCGKGILHHLNLDAALAEIVRVLVPGGRAVFIEPLGHNPLINWYRNHTPEIRTPDEKPLVRADLKTIRSYFETVEYTFYNLTTLLALPLGPEPLFSKVLSGCSKLDSWLMRLFPGISPYCWLVLMDMRGPRKMPAVA